MNEPEYGTPEWHQHILDTLHDETGVRVHHDRMEFPGGHTFPVLLPKIVNSSFIKFGKKNDYRDASGITVSEHLYPREFWVGQHTVNNERHHSLDFFHTSHETEHNDVQYSTEDPTAPNLLHPEQFGPEVQKRLRTVHDPEIGENERKELMEDHKERVQRHLNRNKKILFRDMDKNSNGEWKSTLYNPHTGEVQHLNDNDWSDY